MKYVVSLSGGMDSSTLIYDLLEKGNKVKAITFDYGQRHIKEINSAKDIALHAGIDHEVIDVSFLKALLPGSSLTDDKVAVPEGHYESESMKDTVVPNRNMIFTSILAAHALAIGYDGVALGIHAGDHAIYPDCRPEWAARVLAAVKVGNWEADEFQMITPFVDMSKTDICKRGLELGVPYELTTTCYNGGAEACGKCGSCQERLEAFRDSGAIDPISYESYLKQLLLS